MKLFTIAAFALVLFVSPSSALTIKNDPGGVVIVKQLEVLKAKKSGEIVRVDGYCGSACTLHFTNPKACATDKAILMFHAATNDAGSRYLWKVYPANIKSYIKANGGLTKKQILARGKVAQQLIGAC